MKVGKNYGIEFVVIDTIARIVEGKENDNDTWNNLEKYTERMMKRDGITFLRIDHPGKDKGKGPRGGSAKQGDVDITWLLTKTSNQNLRLQSIGNRFPLEHNDLVLKRVKKPRLMHEVVSMNTNLNPEERIEILSDLLDEHGHPNQLSVKQTGQHLRKLGQSVSNDVASLIRKQRMTRIQPLENHDDEYPDSPPFGTYYWALYSTTKINCFTKRNTLRQTQWPQGKYRSDF